MRLTTSEATEIDADFDISSIGEEGRFDVTIESAGGAGVDGRTRNPEYPRLFEELLRRAAAAGAVVEDAVVDSRPVAGLTRAERRIHVEGREYPFGLANHEDFSELRKRFTRPQASIASARRGGGGNERKRVTISFRIEDASVDRSGLIALLGAIESAPRARKTGVADGLTRVHVEGAIERCKQLGRETFLAEFGAPAARRYVLVDGDDTEADAMAVILAARALAGMDIEGPWREDRANVAVPLRALGFGVEDLDRPREAPLGADPANYSDLAERLGGTDVAVKRMGRREQRFLRGALGIGSGDPQAPAQCGMCARMFPQSLLVAAHIKPRHLCSDDERLDMPHVGWALCLLGCDVLFEQGYVGVIEGGRVRALCDMRDEPYSLREAVDALAATVAPGWTARRQRYFNAHATHHSTRL